MSNSSEYEDFVEKTYFLLRFLFSNLLQPSTRLKHFKTIFLGLKSLFVFKNFVHRIKKIYFFNSKQRARKISNLRAKIREQKDYIFCRELDLFPRTINFALKFIGKVNANSFKSLKRLDLKRLSNPFKNNTFHNKNLFHKKSVLDFLTFQIGNLKKANAKIVTNLIFFCKILKYKDINNFY